jgi:hypothetical protein|tara:strand:- start:2599 stop:2976 length:378 start_codon:yes stop_codon:yes gene_type:complete
MNKKYNSPSITNKLKLNFLALKILFFLILIQIIINISWQYLIKFKKTITIEEKNTYGSRNSDGNQTVNDTEGNIYVVKNSLYYLHWESVELYNKLDVGKTYKVEGYGMRIPILNTFPVIIKAKNI